jgi:hypothetical protein
VLVSLFGVALFVDQLGHTSGNFGDINGTVGLCGLLVFGGGGASGAWAAGRKLWPAG